MPTEPDTSAEALRHDVAAGECRDANAIGYHDAMALLSAATADGDLIARAVRAAVEQMDRQQREILRRLELVGLGEQTYADVDHAVEHVERLAKQLYKIHDRVSHLELMAEDAHEIRRGLVAVIDRLDRLTDTRRAA